MTTTGKVYLVGAGPGDPELLTLKALRLLRTAGAVLHDDLVAPEILKLISSSARVINVGKRCGKKKISQEEIHFLMIALAQAGLDVVRLKGGDPLIFGRAGEEMEALRTADVEFEIVPGITSALGAAAAAQIPVTHRSASSALVLITAHQASQAEAANWAKLAGGGATLAIYMPGGDYAEIAAKLTAAGMAKRTPTMMVASATTPRQQIYCTTIGELPRAARLSAPTMLIVGEVVGLADPAVLARDSAVLTPASGKMQPLFMGEVPSRLNFKFETNEEPLA